MKRLIAKINEYLFPGNIIQQNITHKDYHWVVVEVSYDPNVFEKKSFIYRIKFWK